MRPPGQPDRLSSVRSERSPHMHRTTFIAHLLLLLLSLHATAEPGPRHIYLTWQGDTSTTMTVVFQTMTPVKNAQVHFGREPSTQVGGYDLTCQARTIQFPGLNRWVHFAQLTELEPAETYFFRAGASSVGFSRERKFRTIAAGAERTRFVVGGDMWIEEATFELMRQAASQSPNFALVGGDMAYADGRLSHVNFWDKWLDGWDKYMVTPSGHMIPMVLAIGNHETAGGFAASPEAAPYYYHFFKQDKLAYFSRQFGSDIIVYILDSGHTNPQGGAQAQWLAQEMERTRGVRHRFALYHVPCYPSYPGAFSGPYSAGGRKHWVPLFDRYRLRAAFENHYHTFKRTKPLRNNKVDPTGTVYLGDGCWGRPPRQVKAQKDWYDEVLASRRHVWLVDIDGGSVRYRAMDPHGKVFDTYEDPEGKVEK
jgi:Purple acid Phosphatase, N-terminal domain/Calcineurin-like phosphoesterase